MSFWGFDQKVHTGNLVVSAVWAKRLTTVFDKLFDAHFHIRSMKLIDAFGADDHRSMKADNTSAYNGRYVNGTHHWSMHAYGLAIDINTVENPWVDGNDVSPPNGRPYADRSRKATGMIHAGDAVVRAFASIGWKWGGYWTRRQGLPALQQHGRLRAPRRSAAPRSPAAAQSLHIVGLPACRLPPAPRSVHDTRPWLNSVPTPAPLIGSQHAVSFVTSYWPQHTCLRSQSPQSLIPPPPAAPETQVRPRNSVASSSNTWCRLICAPSDALIICPLSSALPNSSPFWIGCIHPSVMPLDLQERRPATTRCARSRETLAGGAPRPRQQMAVKVMLGGRG